MQVIMLLSFYTVTNVLLFPLHWIYTETMAPHRNKDISGVTCPISQTPSVPGYLVSMATLIRPKWSRSSYRLSYGFDYDTTKLEKRKCCSQITLVTGSCVGTHTNNRYQDNHSFLIPTTKGNLVWDQGYVCWVCYVINLASVP